MTVTSPLFEAFLKCLTKCYLRSIGETGNENPYANWIRTENESYLRGGIKRLSEEAEPDEFIIGVATKETLEMGEWRLGVNLIVRSESLESNINAVEKVFSGQQCPIADFIPIRFIFTNKLTPKDKLASSF